MAFNNGQAIAVNVLARYLMPETDRYDRERPSSDEARDALARLADDAHKHFMAGVTGADIHEHWNQRAT